MVKLSIFNAQGSRVIIVVVLQVAAVKMWVAVKEALRKKGKTQSNSVYHQNILVVKLVWVPVISFCKIFIPNYNPPGPIKLSTQSETGKQ
jgi:predicted oxidoreductase (fatty acid repression mutant protein)